MEGPITEAQLLAHPNWLLIDGKVSLCSSGCRGSEVASQVYDIGTYLDDHPGAVLSHHP